MPKVLVQTYFEAESPRHAWYQIRMIQLAEGFAVEKKSGSCGRKAHTEAWFRWESTAAQKVYNKILRVKTQPGRKRVYREVPSHAQLELF